MKGLKLKLGRILLLVVVFCFIWSNQMLRAEGAAPSFISSPISQTVTPGATVTFHAVANADSAFYEWYRDSSYIVGVFSNTLVLTNVQLSDAGDYVAFVYDSTFYAGFDIHSAPAHLVVLQAPQITSDPVSQTNVANANVAFSVVANGGPKPTYQWILNDSPVAGATERSLILPNIQSQNAGVYTVVVSNSVAAITSAPAILVVTNAPPTLVTNLSNRVAIEGTCVGISPVVYGTAPLFYQWHLNGTDIPGATNLILDFTPIRSTNAGKYSVTISNNLGSVTSRVATVTIKTYADPGFTMIAWGNNSTGQTNPPVGATNVVALAAGSYQTILLRQDGSLADVGSPLLSAPGYQALRRLASVGTRGDYGLAIANDGTPFGFGLTYLAGDSDVPASISNVVATAIGTPRLALKDDGTVAGWLPANYIGPPDPSGVLSFLPKLSNVIDIAMRDSHGLALKSDHTVVAFGDGGHGETNVPAGLNNVVAIAAGSSHCLVLKSNGTIVAWGDNSLGQTNVPIGLSNVIAISVGDAHNLALKSDGTVVAWGNNGDGQCNVPLNVSNVVFISAGDDYSAVLVKQPATAITTVPQMVLAGATVTFTFVATGDEPLFYQWQFNGTNINGANGSTLTLTNVPVSIFGFYQCLVSNGFGTVTGNITPLNVYRQTPVLDPLWDQEHSTNGSFGFLLKYLSGHGPILIEASTNLMDWEPIYTNLPVTGSLEYFDTGITNQRLRFYRANEE